VLLLCQLKIQLLFLLFSQLYVPYDSAELSTSHRLQFPQNPLSPLLPVIADYFLIPVVHPPWPVPFEDPSDEVGILFAHDQVFRCNDTFPPSYFQVFSFLFQISGLTYLFPCFVPLEGGNPLPRPLSCKLCASAATKRQASCCFSCFFSFASSVLCFSSRLLNTNASTVRIFCNVSLCHPAMCSLKYFCISGAA